ncbi:cell division protein FtsZ [Gemmobacter megaterium]|uniref:Cell division protein FtsZ n=1 Tax=Gemmobacter megaterium TaxID=1086013 RepID=A0A1N7P0M8_9RHOB|nr:cell division protein FtsZ [Gemmobacter megaterium]GGE15343.1 cell division protein FtsZ [Gemmobacter megaterium]SIT04120.1 cell division protein FtsZ [Gemmobacter megaterium]
MALNLIMQDDGAELKPRITVFGVGGAGGNAVNNMIDQQLEGVDFVVANTDAQALAQSRAPHRVQLGARVTEGLGAGAKPQIGAAAAEESIEQIVDHLAGVHMCFITAGMGGGTGTGAAPIIAQAARELGVLTVGVVTKPFAFEGAKRMRQAEDGVEALQKVVDTLIIIPNQNLFRLANEKTTFTEAFAMADDVLYQGVKGVTDLMVRPGLINLDFADVRSVMDEMGKAMMGTGEAEGANRAIEAAEKAIANPLLDEISLHGAKGVLINITGGYDLTLFELDEAAGLIREKVDPDANIIVGSTMDPTMEGRIRVSVVATGIDATAANAAQPRASGTLAQPRAAASFVAPTQAPAPAPAPQPAAPAAFQPAAPAPQQYQPQVEDDLPAQDLFHAAAAPAPRAQPVAQHVEPDVPEPVYRPEARAPQPQPVARPAPPSIEADAGTFVAPRRSPAGTPSPEALARLRDAVSKTPAAAPMQQARMTAAAPQPSQPRVEEPARSRFGLGSLIGRMAGQAGAAPEPGQPQSAPQAARVQPQPPAHAAYDDEQDHEQDRIEIPAFLRRQAN